MNGSKVDDQPIPTMWAGWRVGVFRPRLWAWSWLLWLLYYLSPVLAGWFLKQAFDALASDESVGRWMVGVGLTEGARMVFFAAAVWFVVRWWVSGRTMMSTNMLFAQTASGGPHRAGLPSSPSEAISRFYDDTRDVLVWTDSWLDGVTNISFGVVAIAIMATIDAPAALVTLVPLALITLVINWMRPRLHAADHADREATGTVNAFLGETFGAVMAFRFASKEPAVIARLERHGEHRRKTAVRAVMLEQSLDGLSSTSSDVTIGLILLVLVPRVRQGEISVGDMALFVTYAETLGTVPRFVARLATSREQARVSLRRLGELVAPGRFEDLMAHPPVSIDRGEAPVRRDPDPSRDSLEHLEVRGLSATYASTGAGVRNVDLSVERGQFVVITGPVGSGKSTLLRALVGLVPRQGGEVRWNGAPVDDLGAWFVPPMAAHLPQVPRLFSETLAENIALGRELDELGPGALDEVIDATALRAELADMPDGLDTVVGSRGLRLSGGQAQRVATARSLLPDPELLVVDDLSSALDVETERALWTRVRDRGTTVIAVSHRAFVLDMADQVITLDTGVTVSDT